MRRLFTLSMLALAACGQLSQERPPIASSGGGVNPESPMATSGISDLATGENVGTKRSASKEGPIAKEFATAEVMVNTRTGEGTYHLMEYATSDTWMFWRKVDNGNGTVTWTFIRPKRTAIEEDDLRPKPGKR
ncbi:MAG: hypothetical protein HYY16_14125 [Planctomycetes bacterium]|nr:hypothetical protein [Planctomycetota bacterium]